ncbi:hypothetical protein THF1C08_20344 [Vibrio jasicida]|uniref:Uncharacterized protein n=1 Tax=Vibrio jasicida TaxID=766224 RepID=A0AAU9QLV7_9VIBR|nr:hypothetical protein THF1C08_20344 [Vibrio jasicida]CAH1587000.1 hypothetical protein THF1A12_20346 [Vibrio jasicida]
MRNVNKALRDTTHGHNGTEAVKVLITPPVKTAGWRTAVHICSLLGPVKNGPSKLVQTTPNSTKHAPIGNAVAAVLITRPTETAG